VTAGSDAFYAGDTIRFNNQSIVEIVNRWTNVARDQVESLANFGALA
jgi:hypothetical protein